MYKFKLLEYASGLLVHRDYTFAYKYQLAHTHFCPGTSARKMNVLSIENIVFKRLSQRFIFHMALEPTFVLCHGMQSAGGFF